MTVESDFLEASLFNQNSFKFRGLIDCSPHCLSNYSHDFKPHTLEYPFFVLQPKAVKFHFFFCWCEMVLHVCASIHYCAIRACFHPHLQMCLTECLGISVHRHSRRAAGENYRQYLGMFCTDICKNEFLFPQRSSLKTDNFDFYALKKEPVSPKANS